mmetsp:Transcript_90470/g.163184  ORF Transcript_90470/g.163184 Transcript_90470/m.163184 type:complete len:204 (-) Transcript_90470:595-1206(-)
MKRKQVRGGVSRCALSSDSQALRHSQGGPGSIREFLLDGNRASRSSELGHLVEVQVCVGLVSILRDDLRVLQVLVLGRQLARDCGHGSELGTCQVDVGSTAKSVREIPRGRRHNGRIVCHASLVAHAQGAAWQLCAGSDLAIDAVEAFLYELCFVHLGWRSHPELGGKLSIMGVQQLAGGAEVADVGHAGADEDLIDLLTGHR